MTVMNDYSSNIRENARKKVMQELKEYRNELLKRAEQEKNNDSVNRHYYIVDQENINKYLKMYENLLKTIKSNKDYTCHHYEYQQGNE